MFNILTYKQTEEHTKLLESIHRSLKYLESNVANQLLAHGESLEEIKSEIRNMNSKMHTLLPKDVKPGTKWRSDGVDDGFQGLLVSRDKLPKRPKPKAKKR